MLSNLIPPQARLAAACLGAAAVFAAGVASDRLAPIVGANAQLARERAAGDAWRDKAAANARSAWSWKASADACRTNRGIEQGQAVVAANEAQRACDARVAAARRSALAIQSIVNREVPQDANGCPERRLVDPGELRDALRAAGPAPGR